MPPVSKPVPTFQDLMLQAADKVGHIKGFEYFPGLAVDITWNKVGSEQWQVLMTLHPFAKECMRLLLDEVLQLAADRADMLVVKSNGRNAFAMKYTSSLPDGDKAEITINKQSILDLKKLFV